MGDETMSKEEYASELSRLQALRPTLQKICILSGTAGASIGVLHHGQVLYTDNIGYRNVAARTVADSRTLYGIGELTKSMVAVAVGKLVSDGKLSWETPIKEILPEFQHRDPLIAHATTVCDILAHRTGLDADTSLAFQGDSDTLLPAAQLIPTINNLQTVTPFRQGWYPQSYDNWGYALAGCVIERLTFASIHDSLDMIIFNPLGMHNTTTRPSFSPNDNAAEQYASLASATTVHIEKTMGLKDSIFTAATGVYSNVDDMLTWSALLLDQYRSGRSDASSLKELDTIFSAHSLDANNHCWLERSCAMGWIRTQLPGVLGAMGENAAVLGHNQGLPELGRGAPSQLCIYHLGSTVGYNSSLLLFPQTQSAVVVLANSTALTDSADSIAQAIAQSLFDFPVLVNFLILTETIARGMVVKYDDMLATIARRRQPGANRHSLKKYSGRYWNELGNFVLEITVTKEKRKRALQLSFQGLGSQTYPLRHLAGNTFEWVLSLDEVARRGRYHRHDVSYFTIDFLGEAGKVNKLNWAGHMFVKKQKPDSFGKLCKFLGSILPCGVSTLTSSTPSVESPDEISVEQSYFSDDSSVVTVREKSRKRRRTAQTWKRYYFQSNNTVLFI
jgi:CubicO group peptidase (beta-lactamase class C family)